MITKELHLKMVIDNEEVTLTARASGENVSVQDLVVMFTHLIVSSEFTESDLSFDDLQDYVCDSLYEAYSKFPQANCIGNKTVQ